eukprot:s1_g1647.t1
MQNEFNTAYNGLLELQIAEKHLENYNQGIVGECLRSVGSVTSCVDFGAGIGTLSLIFRDKFGVTPVCVEIDEENKRHLAERGFEYVDDINAIGKRVDLVFSSNVLEHIEDDLAALRAIREKLDQNGYVFLYLPAFMVLWTNMDETVGHFRRYTRAELKQKLQSVGFDVEAIYFADSVGFFASLAMKLFGHNSESGIGSPSSLAFYDRYILPISRFLDAAGLKFFFGKNVIAVARKSN